MKAVSDTSPICYLLLIERVDLLGMLFERVSIPSAVRDELKAVPAFKEWLASPGFVSLVDVVERLERTSFRVEPKLIKALLDRHRGGSTGPAT